MHGLETLENTENHDIIFKKINIPRNNFKGAGNMDRTFNINSYVKVKLTKEGNKILREQYKETLSKMTPQQKKAMGRYKPPQVDEEGYAKFKLWQLMNHFGKYMYNGNMNPPFCMDIKIAKEDLKDE